MAGTDPAFVHLHLHSNYSFCRGANTLAALAHAVKRQGQRVFALTDIDGLYGLLWARYIAAAEGLRLIAGAEVRDREGRVVALVKSPQGFENLSLLLSQKHLQGERFSLATVLPARHHGLVLMSDIPALLQHLRALPGLDLYALCIPGRDGHRLLRFAREHGLSPVAANDVYCIRPEDYRVHQVLRAIDTNSALSRIPAHELASDQAWLKPPAAMAAAFPGAPDALANTLQIARKCQYEPRSTGHIFPNFPTPGGARDIDYLHELCLHGVTRRYGAMTDEIQARLDKELNVIAMKGFASHFLVVWDIVQHASRTCGRGSAAASLVSYLLGITHVDPLRYNLFFERFLHIARDDPPDIDIDFPWDERDGMLDYVFAKYGVDATAMVSNHVTFKGRAALREIAKCYGLSEAEINNITKRFSGFTTANVAAAMASHPKFAGVELPEPWPEIIAIADRINGYPRHLGTHCGGVIITPRPVAHYFPVQQAPKGVRVLQFEKDQAEDFGFVKLDLLGNRSLAVIRDAVEAVAQNTGIALDFKRMNAADDPAAQQLMATGQTMGGFYVESPAMRQLLQKAQTGKLEDLFVLSSIIRPAANKYIREYVRRLRGGAYQPLHPLVEETLAETYGIMCYQEDISRVAIALCDFSVADADGLRKAFSRKDSERVVPQYRAKFFAGARRKGVDDSIVGQVWEMILSFSGYSFCKPHSASYALVSFQAIYLRAHFPAEFIAAVISNGGGYYSTFAYLSEAKRMGLRVLPLDINHSEKKYTGRGRELRIGFMLLKGFPDAAIDRILAARRSGGPFVSFADCVRRARLVPAEQEVLIKGGAFDRLEGVEMRPVLLWRAAQRRARQHAPRRHESQQMTLLGNDTGPPLPAEPALKPFSDRDLLRQELAALGMIVSRHPLTLFEHRLRDKKLVPAKELRRYIGKQVRVAGWYITGKPVITKKDEPMEFITFEDTTGLIETAFFPPAYRKYCQFFDHSRPLVLTGKVEEEFGAVSLNVHTVEAV